MPIFYVSCQSEWQIGSFPILACHHGRKMHSLWALGFQHCKSPHALKVSILGVIALWGDCRGIFPQIRDHSSRFVIYTVFPHIVAAATILFWIHLLRKLFKFSFPLCNVNLNSFLTRWGNYSRRGNYSREETIWGNTVDEKNKS